MISLDPILRQLVETRGGRPWALVGGLAVSARASLARPGCARRGSVETRGATVVLDCANAATAIAGQMVDSKNRPAGDDACHSLLAARRRGPDLRLTVRGVASGTPVEASIDQSVRSLTGAAMKVLAGETSDVADFASCRAEWGLILQPVRQPGRTRAGPVSLPLLSAALRRRPRVLRGYALARPSPIPRLHSPIPPIPPWSRSVILF